jgi:hypothetical protein
MITPAPGQMILYDDITPPLADNSYRMTLQTNVSIDSHPQPLDSKQAFFNIEGPRFRLNASDVASVVPPRNGHGPFTEVAPHIAIYRRTLPWERKINLDGKPVPKPNTNADLPALESDGMPWLALLLFEEGEYTLLQNQPLDQVVPQNVIQLMGNPQVTCDAIEVRTDLLASVMPSLEELQLLAHVRQVNVDDRELDVGSKDGFFSVVMANRLPSPGAKCRACLVSLEGRLDLVPVEPPSQTPGFATILEAGVDLELLPPGFGIPPQPAPPVPPPPAEPAVVPHAALFAGNIARSPARVRTPIQFLLTTRLVLLHSWQYETIGDSNFRGLMQRLDVGLIGKVKDPGHPPITDSAHIKMDVTGRAGVEEQAWYRGPLVPFQLTRDSLGPYHSADQCRRATPETGGEDVSFAAAFEAGRLLAAADLRLAQELMRWRREAFKQSSRADSVALARASLAAPAIDLHAPVAPVLSANAAVRAVSGIGPVADPYALGKIGDVVGLNPAAVQQAFHLQSPAEAVALLGGDAGALGATVAPVAQTERPNTTLDEVAADTASLDRLNQTRNQLIANVNVKLGRSR